MRGWQILPALASLLAIALALAGAPPVLAVLCQASAGAIAWLMWPRVRGEASRLRAALVSGCFPLLGVAFLVHEPVHPVRPDRKPRHRAQSRERPPRAMDPLELLRRELSVRPFLDELRFGTLAEKRRAANAIAELGTNRSVSTLRSALTDVDGDTRLFASLALLRMEERCMAELKAARTGADDAPAHLRHSEAARRYAESGLPTGGVAIACWEEVRAAALACLELTAQGPLRTEALLHLSAAQRALGELQAAVQSAQEADADDPRSLLAQCEALFALGELDRLRPLASKLAHLAPYWRTHAR